MVDFMILLPRSPARTRRNNEGRGSHVLLHAAKGPPLPPCALVALYRLSALSIHRIPDVHAKFTMYGLS